VLVATKCWAFSAPPANKSARVDHLCWGVKLARSNLPALQRASLRRSHTSPEVLQNQLHLCTFGLSLILELQVEAVLVLPVLEERSPSPNLATQQTFGLLGRARTFLDPKHQHNALFILYRSTERRTIGQHPRWTAQTAITLGSVISRTIYCSRLQRRLQIEVCFLRQTKLFVRLTSHSWWHLLCSQVESARNDRGVWRQIHPHRPSQPQLGTTNLLPHVSTPSDNLLGCGRSGRTGTTSWPAERDNAIDAGTRY
jgi:hypothetical protein